MKNEPLETHEQQEKIGCIIILIIFTAVIGFFWWRSDRALDIGMRKLDFCIEKNLDTVQCQAVWEAIPVSKSKKGK